MTPGSNYDDDAGSDFTSQVIKATTMATLLSKQQ